MTGDAHAPLRMRLEAARWDASMAAPYAAPALAAATLVITDLLPAITMASDRHWRVYAHPDLTWSRAEAAWVWLHEVLGHLVRGHAQAATGLDYARANLAQDLEIESWEWPDSRISRPQDGVHPSRMSPPLPSGEVWRWYYDRLPDSPHLTQDCGSCAAGPARGYEVAAPEGSAVNPMTASLISHNVALAAIEHAAHHHGDVPAGLEVWARATLAPPLPTWRQRLRQIVSLSQRPGMTEQCGPPRERRDILTPRWREPAPKIAIVADTSGSMSDADGARVMRVVAQAVDYAGVADIYWCDVHVTRQTVRRGQKLRPIGGGGTILTAAVEQAAASRPDLLVLVTDGLLDWPSRPACRHVAIITRDANGGNWPAIAIKEQP